MFRQMQGSLHFAAHCADGSGMSAVGRLIDALASAVVVVLAFVGTTMAFNGSTASVARDAKKTQALIVAQNSINEMRGMASATFPTFSALNDTTKTVTYRGDRPTRFPAARTT